MKSIHKQTKPLVFLLSMYIKSKIREQFSIFSWILSKVGIGIFTVKVIPEAKTLRTPLLLHFFTTPWIFLNKFFIFDLLLPFMISLTPTPIFLRSFRFTSYAIDVNPGKVNSLALPYSKYIFNSYILTNLGIVSVQIRVLFRPTFQPAFTCSKLAIEKLPLKICHTMLQCFYF